MTRRSIALVGVFVLGLVAVVGLLRIQTYPGPNRSREWLVISVPTVDLRPTSSNAVFTVSFFLSNAGPRSLEFRRSWLECRTRAGPSSKVINQSITGLPGLPSGSAVGVTNHMPWYAGDDLEPLVCCGISWSERGAPLRRAAESLANANTPWCSWIHWTYPWRSRPLARGTTCASSTGVAEYFRVVHGWERSDWDRWWSEVEKRRNSPMTITNFLRYGLPPRGSNRTEIHKHRMESLRLFLPIETNLNQPCTRGRTTQSCIECGSATLVS